MNRSDAYKPTAATVMKPATGSKTSNTVKKMSEPDVVVIGMYLSDVLAIDLKNHNCLVDFYLWFR